MVSLILLQKVADVAALGDKNFGESIVKWLLDNAVKFGTKIIIAVIVYLVGASIISFIRKFVKKLLTRKEVDGTVASFINSMTNMLLKVLLAILIIGVLGIPTVSFAAIIAAAGLAIGMAMKDNLSNFAGGVMILLNKPFKLGDRIVAQTQDGIVQEIGILYTVLLTGDGRTVYMPNGPLSTGNIVNYSDQQNRRADLVYNFSYGNNADNLMSIMHDIIDQNPLILKVPAPFVGITNVYNGNFDITVRVWTLNSDNATVTVELNENIYRTLSQKGIFVSSYITVKNFEK